MSTPPGAATGIRLVLAALGWMYRQTFKLAPPVWLLIAILAAAATVALVSVQPLAAIPVAVVAVGAGAALLAWLVLGRPHGNRLLAFLCPFDELSADATRIAPLQVRALGDRIAADPLLDKAIAVRRLRQPLDPAGARRLLRWTRGHACVSGEVTTAEGRARWSPHLTIRWTMALAEADHFTVRVRRPKLVRPHQSPLEVEAGVPIATFTEAEFSADHAATVHGTLLVLAGQEYTPSFGDYEHNERFFVAADRYRSSLPLIVRVLATIGLHPAPAADDWGQRMRDQGLRMAAAAEHDADHPYLWMEIASVMLMAERSDAVRPLERLPYARRAVDGAPDDPRARLHLGMALMASAEELLLDRLDIDESQRLAAEALDIFRSLPRRGRGEVARQARACLPEAEIAAWDPGDLWGSMVRPDDPDAPKPAGPQTPAD